MPADSFSTSLKQLTSVPLSNDRVVIQVKNQDMTYCVDLDSNYEDRNAYVVGMSQFIEETTVLNQFNTVIEDGWNIYACMIYAWRSLSHALPPVPEDNTKTEYFRACLDLLNEEVSDLGYFHDFIMNTAKPLFIKECLNASSVLQRKIVLTTGILEGLAYFAEMLYSLDLLKDSKVCAKNDFTNFKRMAQLDKNYGAQLPIMKDSDRLSFLSLFLAQNQVITTSIKTDLQKLEGYSNIFCDVLDFVCSKIEEKQYLVPNDKFKLIRSVVAIMHLLDTAMLPIDKLDKKKKLSLSRIDKIIRETPIVPILGDLQLNAPYQLKNLTSCDYNKSFTFYDTSHQKQLEVKNSPGMILRSVEESYYAITADLARCRTVLCKADSSQGSVKYASALNSTFNPEISMSLFTMTYDAFSLLSRMSESLILVYSWKMSNPRIRDPNSIDQVDDPYFARTKENYSSEEKTAMVSLIALIKALFNHLSGLEVILTPPISCHVYAEIQTFINKTVADLLNKVTKSGKNNLLRVMLSGIRSSCGDLVENISGYGTKKKQTINKGMVATLRCVGPLSTQLYTLNNFLTTVLRSKELKKELDSNTVQLLNDFSSKLHIFWTMMNYGKTLRNCCDLSCFWFREFYLEMTNGKRIQYPIETSLPWIFASHVIESSDASQTENLLYVLDLYNDCAEYALTRFRRKHLYDEIEGEVNLIFEQLVHSLSEKIYSYYRTVASSIYFDKSIKGLLLRYQKSSKKDSNEFQVEYAKDHRYKTLLHQNSIQLLGREIDLGNLIGQRLILALRKSFEVAFSSFTSQGIDNIHEFDNLIEITRLTHNILSEHVSLPPFDILFAEANCLEHHKIQKFVMHVLTDIVSDVIPNFAFCSINERFVRGSVCYSNKTTRRQTTSFLPAHFYGTRNLAQSFQIHTEMFRGYIGIEHFCLIMKYAEYGGLAEFVDQMTNFVRTLINDKFASYIDMIKKKMPEKISLPRYQYGLVGSIRYYKANFNHIINYTELHPRIFQCMREIGNCFLIIKSLEDAVRHNEMFQCLFSAVYQGIVPVCSQKTNKNPLMTQSTIHLLKEIVKSDQIMEDINTAQMFTTENLTFGVSIFDYVLYNVKHGLKGDPWDRKFPNNAVVAFDECKDYYRIFSVLCLAMAHPFPGEEESIDRVFGDGLLWCGEVIVALLGESSLASSSDFLHHLMEVENYVTIEKNITNHMFGSRPISKEKSLILDDSDADEDIRFIMPRIRSIDNRRKRISAFISRFLTGPYCHPTPLIRCFSSPTYKRPQV